MSRAKTTTRFSSGDANESLKEVANLADDALLTKMDKKIVAMNAAPKGNKSGGVAGWNDGYPFTAPVGKFKPNPWGLFDMHGNVAEWCQDIFDKSYYQASPEKNPRGPSEGKEYVLRGGSWKSAADALRSTYRLGENPGFSDACLARDAIGFRCVRKAPVETVVQK